MSIGVIIAIGVATVVSAVAGWVISRQLTLRRISKLSKELGAEEVQGAIAKKRLDIHDRIQKERGPLPVRDVPGAWRRLWGIRPQADDSNRGR